MTAHTFTRHDVSFASGDAACAAWLYLPDGSSGSTSAGARVDTASSSPGNVMVALTQLGEPDNIVIEDGRDLAGLSRWARVTKEAIDGALDLSWHTDQLHRLGAGLDPDPDRGRLATTVAMLRRNGRAALRKRGGNGSVASTTTKA